MINKRATLSVLFVLALGLVISCNSTKIINENFFESQIIVVSTQCGSYEVKSDEITIGYVVKPIVVEVDKVKEITEFERKLKMKFKNKFIKKLRSYTFTKDIAGDTILMTVFLTPKEVENIPNWECELQEVQIYPKGSEWVDYNCSKNRFKVTSDPD